VTPVPGHEIRTNQEEASGYRLATLDWEFPQPRKPEFIWRFTAIIACKESQVELAILIQVQWRSFAVRPFHVVLEGDNPLVWTPRLLSSVLGGWSCRLGGQPVPTQPRMLQAAEVEAFVNDILLNGQRALPILLLALGEQLAVDANVLQGMQNRLLGLAEVAALADQAAADRLTECLGPERSCAGGLIRIYWPGFTKDAPPAAHPLDVAERVLPALASKQLETHYLLVFAPTSGHGFRESALVRAARDAVILERNQHSRRTAADDRRLASIEAELAQARSALGHSRRELENELREIRAARDEFRQEAKAAQRQAQAATKRAADAEAEVREVRASRDKLRQERDAAEQRLAALQTQLQGVQAQLEALQTSAAPILAPSGESFEDLMAELERGWDENARLQAALEDARGKVDALEAELHDYRENWALVTGITEEEPPPPPLPVPPPKAERTFDSVAHAVRVAAEEFADVLVVWEDAYRSAERSTSKVSGKVFRALQAIAEVGREYFRAQRSGAPLGRVDQAFSRRIPFKYSAFESQTTMSMYGEQRVFHHLGKSRQMQRHLTLSGGGETSNCLQIYFDFDEESERVLIGYCGRHLPYYSQRT
jgi:predicted  nucleic acid-binding Zn-ribbon protein